MPLTIHQYGSLNARTAVLVHGLTETGTTWPDLVGHWGDDGHVLAPDLRGHGQSARGQVQAGHVVASLRQQDRQTPGPISQVCNASGYVRQRKQQ